jgi:outer membrane protein assembly factor BamB
MKRRGILTILIIIIIALILIFSGIYIIQNWSEKIPEDKVTEPILIDVPEDTWPQFRLTVTHNGISHLNASLKGTITKTWRSADINKEYYTASKSSPAVDKDMVYIGADTGKLHALWRSNGTGVWSFQTRWSKNGIHGSPAFDDEKVYVGAYDGWLYAVYKSNGTLAWENELGDYIGSSPALFNGVVYIGVEMGKPAGYLVGCNMTTGEEVFRSAEFGSHPHSTPSIDPKRGYIYIGANDEVLYCYNLTSKTEVWNFTADDDIKSTPCVTNDILYVTSWDKKLYALDLSTGEEYFNFQTKMRIMSSPSIDRSGKRLFFGSHDWTIYCIDARSGKELWKFQTGGKILSSPTILEKDKSVICGSNDGFVYILDMETGKKKKQIELESGISSVPVIVQNQLYVFDNEGILHRFDAS